MATVSEELNEVLAEAGDIAKKAGTLYLASEHLVYAMLNTDCVGGRILRDCGISVDEYDEYFMNSLMSDWELRGATPRTKAILKSAGDLAEKLGGPNASVGTVHLLAAIANVSECTAMHILMVCKFDFDKLFDEIEREICRK